MMLSIILYSRNTYIYFFGVPNVDNTWNVLSSWAWKSLPPDGAFSVWPCQATPPSTQVSPRSGYTSCSSHCSSVLLVMLTGAKHIQAILLSLLQHCPDWSEATFPVWSRKVKFIVWSQGEEERTSQTKTGWREDPGLKFCSKRSWPYRHKFKSDMLKTILKFPLKIYICR